MRRSVDAPDDRTWILCLTGAGVSAESGIPTFRDANGLWRNHAVEAVASPEGFASDPALVWTFYAERRAAARTCVPNAAHHALAALEARLGDRFLLATQNVDGLHARAGSTRMVELHGNLFTTRCSSCDRPPFADEVAHASPPRCHCGRLLRPHIVWFGESLDPGHLRRVARFMDDASRRRFIFLAVGTSGLVYPAAGLAREARRRGAETHLVNAEAPANLGDFVQFHQGKAGEILPGLFAGVGG